MPFTLGRPTVDRPRRTAVHAVLDPDVPAFEPPACRNSSGPLAHERHVDAAGSAVFVGPGFPSDEDTRFDLPDGAGSGAALMKDLKKASEVIGTLLEVRNRAHVRGVPQRADQRHQRGLAGAVLAHEQGERG